MEKNLGDESNVDPNDNSGNSVTNNDSEILSGYSPQIIKINELNEAFATIRTQIDNAIESNVVQITVTTVLCIAVLILSAVLGREFYNFTDYPQEWTWQMIYFSLIRITIITAVFSLASFLFRLLRSYLHIYQRNKHRKVVVNSMASLIISAPKDIDINYIYKTLLEIIVNFDRTGILKKEEDFKTNHSSELFDNCKKYIDSKMTK